MSDTPIEEKFFLTKMKLDVRHGLSVLSKKENWLELYENWSKDERNQFSSLLEVTDAFNLPNASISYSYNDLYSNHADALEVIKMSIFLSENLMQVSRETFSNVSIERNRYKKLLLIDSYFEIVDEIVNSQELSGCIISLNEVANKQMVLQGARSVDLYLCFYSLRELLRKETTESIYLLFTYWRITISENILNTLLDKIINYIRNYFENFDKDSQMHLNYPVDELITVKKLAVISHWLKIIAFHTDGIFKEYIDMKWFFPVDRMADDIVGTTQISKFEMLQFKRIFIDDDDETVIKKAIGNHGYAIWIKTVDVMYIFCDICQVLYCFKEDELKKMNTTKYAMLELYDNMTKIKNYYTSKVFYHQVYFELERTYFDSRITKALEDDAELLSKTVDDVLAFVDAIASDDIQTLMQAKIRYASNINHFSTEEQKKKLDVLTNQIVEKIKDALSKKDIYDELYGAVADEFALYSNVLMKHPKIFSSLVSAEYLYKQYIDGKQANDRFDYSCISIMYYMALEDFTNKLVYVPYYSEVLSLIDKETINIDWINCESKKYVSKYNKFWDNKKVLKKSLEIGVLGHLFRDVKEMEYFEKFLKDRYTNVDIDKLEKFGCKLIDKSKRRNNAAHGGNYISYEDVCVDKNNVYNVIEKYRGLILELMEILFK